VPGGDDGTTPGATRLQRLQLQLAQARRADDLKQQRAVQSEIVAIFRNRVENTKLTGQALVRFRQELSSQEDVLDGIQDQINADAAARADARRQAEERAAAERLRKQRAAAEERRRKQREAAAAAAAEAKRAAEEADRQWQEIAIAMTSPSTWREALAARSEALNARFSLDSKAAMSSTEPGLTVADMRRMQVEFLQSLQGIMNQFGGNLTSDGTQTATNTWTMTQLLREQNRLLDGLTRGVQHPGAKYARSVLMEPYGDVGSV
jgi:colicin import membrane protein